MTETVVRYLALNQELRRSVESAYCVELSSYTRMVFEANVETI